MNPHILTDQLSLFLDVLETGSFSAAARRHPLTPSAVARRIDSLESSVGSRLFQRSTHAVLPTPAGLAFAERARRIVTELQLARAEAVSLSHAPEGLIRVDAPAAFGRRHRGAGDRRLPERLPGAGCTPAFDRQLRGHAGRAPG